MKHRYVKQEYSGGARHLRLEKNMLLFLNFFKKKNNNEAKSQKANVTSIKPIRTSEQVATRKGEIGEYKIDIQLDQLPKDYRYLSDLLLKNSKAKSGYSQVDHIVLTPYGIFVIETKNYQGTIYAGKDQKSWSVNGKFKMMKPLCTKLRAYKSTYRIYRRKVP